MKQSSFESEFDESDLPALTGAPMQNPALSQAVGAIGPAVRVQESLANLLGEAVFSYYFAKRVAPELEHAANTNRGPLASAFSLLQINLVKQAVIGIASTMDLTTGRTRSIPHALDRLTVELTMSLERSPSDETLAAADLITDIRQTTDTEIIPSLKYVRHLRNKWAGHSSLDRTVDSWGDADSNINFPLLEDALVRMVWAVCELGTLTHMSADLRRIENQDMAGANAPAGIKRIPMTVAWNGVDAMATVMRGAAQAAGEAFLARLTLTSMG